VSMDEALRRAEESSDDLASNKRLGIALRGTDEIRVMNQVFACWSGTMAGYDKPDKKLGKTISYLDSQTGIRYVFPVPEEHVGKTNVVLVAEHPNYYLEIDRKTRTVRAENVGIVTGFPAASANWYLGDPEYAIPTGKIMGRDNQDALFLFRIDKRVGLVSRVFDDGDGRRGVGLYKPNCGLGVAIEVI
jgi:hypothetical protein